MSQLQVTKITTVDNTTPLILATGNAGGGQIIVQSSNTDVFFNGNINFSNYVTGDGSGLFLPTSNVANAAFNTANAAYASANNVAPQVTPAFNTANGAFDTANAAFASANNVAPQVTPAFSTANNAYLNSNSAFRHANAAFDSANNVGPQIAPTYNTANAAFAAANIASNTATGAYNAANAAYNNANAAFNAANTKFSSSGGTISGAVEITADLTVHGNTRFIDQQTLSVGDPLIYLAANNYSSDVVDIGFVANYVNATSANVHTGLYRSSGTKEYYLFYGYDKEPINNYIDPTGNNIQQAVLNATLKTSNVILGGANTINWIRSAYAQANAGGANVGQTAPTGVSSGKLWWNSDLGKLYVYYTDPANTSSWVETSPSASAIEGAIVTGYINPVYNTMNVAFNTANAAFDKANTFGGVYGVANAAFAAANNITPQIAPSYNTANASFAKANTALQNTSGTLAGDLTVTGNVDLSVTTAALKIPVGTTTQRPTGAAGMIRFNTTTGYPEWYDSSAGAWVNFNAGKTYTISYLVVAGGGAGPQFIGGGGGAGGMLTGTATVTSGIGYTVTVGAGASFESDGSASSFVNSLYAISVSSLGGGRGGKADNFFSNSGGSGGGGAGANRTTAGSGTAGQGNNGGSGGGVGGGSQASGGGGGGAGAVGQNNQSNQQPGNGGIGATSSITGTSTYYAGGGGGGGDGQGNTSTGGSGGGGNGSGNGNGGNGTANLGGGGGGGRGTNSSFGLGGSGVVIISYASATQIASGGTVTSYTSGPTKYYVHTFTTSGTYTA